MGLQSIQAIPNDGRQQMMTVPESFVFSTTVTLRKNGWAGIVLSPDKPDDGWALLCDHGRQEVHFFQLHHGAVWIDKGLRRLTFHLNTPYEMRAEYAKGILKLYFNVYPGDKDPWPVFEFPIEMKSDKAALDFGRDDTAEFCNTAVKAYDLKPYQGETYTNPVMVGADPDILLHDGVYYLYNRVPNDPSSREDAYLYNGSDRADMDEAGDVNAVFRVTSSRDLVHWSKYKICFRRNEVLQGAFCMSPNVVEWDGWFYLFFAGGRINGEESFHIYCASSRSPEGPFELRSTAPLHREVQEIGGMPFVDTDGTLYLSLVRFNKGNNIWLQKAHLKDGVCTADEASAKPILTPFADYEVDEYGRIVEGAVFIRHKGLYYMIYADGHYLGHYGESCAVAEDIYGPYVRQKNNPILHHHFMADGTGDGIVIYNADRSEVMMGYHRHVSTADVEPRQTCLDRMKFVPDPDGGPDILTVYGPTVTPQPLPFTE